MPAQRRQPPVVRRGVLLDVARQAGVEALRADFTVTPELLEEARAAAGVEILASAVPPVSSVAGGVAARPSWR